MITELSNIFGFSTEYVYYSPELDEVKIFSGGEVILKMSYVYGMDWLHDSDTIWCEVGFL